MKTQEVDVQGMMISIPAYYQKLNSMPDDPEGSVSYGAQTEHAECFSLLFPIAASQAMPRDKEAVIVGIRQCLGEDQGLIQVEATENYVYSIVKTLKQPKGVQYVLTYHRFYTNSILDVQAFFDESGIAGIRDTMVYEFCRRENIVGSDEDPFMGWAQDPYDKNVRHGALMNLSEHEIYDDKFVGFPLSMCREFIRALNTAPSLK